MRAKIKIQKKVLSASADGLQFHDKQVSANRRKAEILAILNIDKQINEFKNIIARAERMQRNKHNLFNL
jgi:hypothetical protein